MVEENVDALPEGAHLKQYVITKILGSGGFGITYLASDTTLDIPVAIKEFLPTDLARRQSDTHVTAKSTSVAEDLKWGLSHFIDEARVLAKFHHKNIIQIKQIFEANNTAYIVMEYADGVSLSEHIKQHAPLSEDETKQILLPIIEGLDAVHAQGFLHRDIKPGNIILRKEGGPVLIDFGSARQAIETKSRSITSIITEGYAPLEQYDPKGNQGVWTDIYALGAVAYKCLTGTTPPTATARVRNDPLVSLDQVSEGRVSPEFASAIAWALRVYEEDRPQTLSSFMHAIDGSCAAPPEMTLPQPGAGDEKTKRMSDDVTRLIPPSEKTVIADVDVNAAAFAAAGTPPRSTKRRAGIVFGALMVFALIAGGVYYANSGTSELVSGPDQNAWEVAARENTISAYETYIRQVPDGKFIKKAEDLIVNIKNKIDEDWNNVQYSSDISEINGFINKYPNETRHISEAKELIDGIERKNTEELRKADRLRRAREQKLQRYNEEARVAYASAISSHTRSEYNDFISSYGGSVYASDVRRRLSQCHMETSDQSHEENNPLKATSRQVGQTQHDACVAARTAAARTIASSCEQSDGRYENPRIAQENVEEDYGTELVGGWIAGALGGREAKEQFSEVYACTSTVVMDCQHTVTSTSEYEVCP